MVVDIVHELRGCISGSDPMYADVRGLLERAAKEIEHLRSVAGAVSQGQTFAEIRTEWHGDKRPGAFTPVLKAFDGA